MWGANRGRRRSFRGEPRSRACASLSGWLPERPLGLPEAGREGRPQTQASSPRQLRALARPSTGRGWGSVRECQWPVPAVAGMTRLTRHIVVTKLAPAREQGVYRSRTAGTADWPPGVGDANLEAGSARSAAAVQHGHHVARAVTNFYQQTRPRLQPPPPGRDDGQRARWADARRRAARLVIYRRRSTVKFPPPDAAARPRKDMESAWRQQGVWKCICRHK